MLSALRLSGGLYMDNKTRPNSNSEYQIRIDGAVVRYLTMLTSDGINEYLELCKANPDKYVDIVVVRTEILFNQFNYAKMKKHFEDV
jgi:hypothetical protein